MEGGGGGPRAYLVFGFGGVSLKVFGMGIGCGRLIHTWRDERRYTSPPRLRGKLNGQRRMSVRKLPGSCHFGIFSPQVVCDHFI